MRNPFIITLVAGIAFASCGGNQPADNNASKKDTGASLVPTANPNGIGKYTDVKVADFDAKMVENGKKIFESKCTPCHKNTDEKLLGPGLKGVTGRRNANWILNMITNPMEMTQKDPVAKELFDTYKTQMTDNALKENEALEVLNYLRSNDGAK